MSSGCGKRPSPCWTSRAGRFIQGYLLDVGERKAAEDQAKELRTAEAVTAEEARDRQRKIEFVAEAASVLASSLDVSSTVGEAAVLATRALAEWCVVDVLAEDGGLARYAVAGGDTPSAATELSPESTLPSAR